MIQCSNCGHQNPDTNSVCSNCGSILQKNNNKIKSKNIIIIISIIVIILSLCCCGGVFTIISLFNTKISDIKHIDREIHNEIIETETNIAETITEQSNSTEVNTETQDSENILFDISIVQVYVDTTKNIEYDSSGYLIIPIKIVNNTNKTRMFQTRNKDYTVEDAYGIIFSTEVKEHSTSYSTIAVYYKDETSIKDIDTIEFRIYTSDTESMLDYIVSTPIKISNITSDINLLNIDKSTSIDIGESSTLYKKQSEDSQYSLTNTVGSEKTGYIEVPNSFYKFQDLGEVPEGTIQYSTVDKNIIITLTPVENGSVDNSIENLIEVFESENVTVETVKKYSISSNNMYSKAILVKYSDESEMFITCFTSDLSEDIMQYIAIEKTYVIEETEFLSLIDSILASHTIGFF